MKPSVEQKQISDLANNKVEQKLSFYTSEDSVSDTFTRYTSDAIPTFEHADNVSKTLTIENLSVISQHNNSGLTIPEFDSADLRANPHTHINNLKEEKSSFLNGSQLFHEIKQQIMMPLILL